jgi:transposase
MLKFNEKPVYLCSGYTDMRKQINGLVAIVESSFKLDPFDNALFVFCNKSRNRIKILEWDGDGFWLYFKRLEKGRFRWLSADDNGVITLSREELYYLLGSPRVIQKLKRDDVKIGAVV